MRLLILGLLLGFIFRIACQQAFSFHYEYVFHKRCALNETLTFSDKLKCVDENTSVILSSLANEPDDPSSCFVPLDDRIFSKRCIYTRKIFSFLTGINKDYWKDWNNYVR